MELRCNLTIQIAHLSANFVGQSLRHNASMSEIFVDIEVTVTRVHDFCICPACTLLGDLSL